MKHFFLLLLMGSVRLTAQTGPNSPASGTNDASTGTIAWTNPGNILSANSVYATVASAGNTNYLVAKNFGFAIGGPANIDGIQLEIKKKELTPSAITILDNWTNGLTKTISPGTNRCLIVVAGIENGNAVRDITAMTYGGRSMTQVLDITSGTTTAFSDRLEVWMLLESDIALASGTTIVPTYAASTLQENVEFYTSVVFRNVDQVVPVYNSTTTASNASTNPHQLGAPFNTLIDGICIAGVVCGNNTTPASSVGATDTYTVNSSFTEGTDIYTANPSFSTSGISVETSTKACTVTGSEQPTFTFAGSVNRAAMFGFTLQRARATDNVVSLLNSNVITGNNYALSSTSWPTSDAYVIYGGPADTWGRTWSVSEINNTGFGAALSASCSNGNLQVDHFRISVYTTSTLPIRLLEFTAAPSGDMVNVHWVTVTEQNNDYFDVERSADGEHFEAIGKIDGAGNSTFPISYGFNDLYPVNGVSYYRLRQTDFNGMHTYSPLVAVNFEKEITATIYPNPGNGVYNFLQEEGSTNEVAVFSADLQLIKKVTIVPGEKAIISISDQEDGVYFLIYEVSGQRKVSRVEKISREY
jgi:hypothetical protein